MPTHFLQASEAPVMGIGSVQQGDIQKLCWQDEVQGDN